MQKFDSLCFSWNLGQNEKFMPIKKPQFSLKGMLFWECLNSMASFGVKI
jgi:hypothetical protein